MTTRWPCLVIVLLCCASQTRAANTWYLMVPPFSSFENSPKGDGVRVLTDPPLVEWRRIGSFDSLQACEKSRQDTIRFLTREDPNPTFSREGAMLNRDSSLLSKCISSDDPRLK
jgi:hypothetical protein